MRSRDRYQTEYEHFTLESPNYSLTHLYLFQAIWWLRSAWL